MASATEDLAANDNGEPTSARYHSFWTGPPGFCDRIGSLPVGILALSYPLDQCQFLPPGCSNYTDFTARTVCSEFSHEDRIRSELHSREDRRTPVLYLRAALARPSGDRHRAPR